MAIFVSTQAYLSINSVDLTSFTKSVQFNGGNETRELTAHGNTSRRFTTGLATYSIDVNLYNNHSTSTVEDTLRALITANSTGVPIEVRELSSTASTTNPRYQFDGVLDGEIGLVSGEHGEVGMVTAKFLPRSAITVSTSASS